MTKRRTTYGGQIPKTTDGLQPQRNILVSMARLVEDLMLAHLDPADVTYPALVAGFVPTYPGNLTVDFAAGRMYERAAVDVAAWGALTADARLVYHQGEAEATNLVFGAAPVTVGHSRIDLVQVARAEVDENGSVLAYYNSSNPAVPLNGPANNGLSQFQDRTQKATLVVKAGVSGAVPVAPTVDAGYQPLYLMTIANGDAAIDATNIELHEDAPFIAGFTSQHHTGAAGSAPKIDLTTEVTGVLPIANGGVLRGLLADRPAAASGLVGGMYTTNDAGTRSTAYVCINVGDDTYEWMPLF